MKEFEVLLFSGNMEKRYPERRPGNQDPFEYQFSMGIWNQPPTSKRSYHFGFHIPIIMLFSQFFLYLRRSFSQISFSSGVESLGVKPKNRSIEKRILMVTFMDFLL